VYQKITDLTYFIKQGYKILQGEDICNRGDLMIKQQSDNIYYVFDTIRGLDGVPARRVSCIVAQKLGTTPKGNKIIL